MGPAGLSIPDWAVGGVVGLGFGAAGLLWTKESEQAQVLIARFSEMPYPINARVDWGCGVGVRVFCPDFVLK